MKLKYFIKYHENSKDFWNKVEESDDEELEEGDLKYSLCIDLEDFITSKHAEESSKRSGGEYCIPDNYELGKKVLQEYIKTTKNKHSKILEEHYRELAQWKSNDKQSLIDFGNWIHEKYVKPKTIETLTSFGAKDITFTESTLDFIY